MTTTQKREVFFKLFTGIVIIATFFLFGVGESRADSLLDECGFEVYAASDVTTTAYTPIDQGLLVFSVDWGKYLESDTTVRIVAGWVEDGAPKYIAFSIEEAGETWHHGSFLDISQPVVEDWDLISELRAKVIDLVESQRPLLYGFGAGSFSMTQWEMMEVASRDVQFYLRHSESSGKIGLVD